MTSGIYGLGRFGSFWAETIRRQNKDDRVLATSRRPHEAGEGIKIVGEEEFFASCDVIYFTVAISAFEEVLKRVAPMIRPGTLVMDTCSVKSMPARWMKDTLPQDCKIIATHPMFGPDSARAGLSGLPIVICPVRVDDETLKEVEDNFASWNLKVLRMSPLEHDREAAYSQGVTHFVGRMLRQMDLHPTEIATQGYKMLMDIVEQTCNDPMQLFCDLQHYNPYAREMRLSLQVATQKVLNRLRESEEEEF